MNGFLLLLFLLILNVVHCDKLPESEKWKKKDVRDYTDADIERLYDQWEDADDEELPEDELPEWKRPQPKIDLSKIDPNNPDAVIAETKKGRTLMMFATVSGNPTEEETQSVTQIWQQSLFNANMEVQRYVVGKDRVLFMLKDGSKAIDIKNFLVSQDRCEVVTIEGRDYYGKASDKYEEPKSKQKDKSKKKQKSKNNKNIENETVNKKKLKSSKTEL